MKRSIATCLMITVLMIIYACPTALASDITLLGPKKYVRTSGPPDSYLNTFSGIPGEARIRLQNGDNSGEKRVEDTVSSAWVRVNGQLVFGPEDFNKNIYIMESTIPIFVDNTLTIELGSAPESYITISITQESLLPQASLQIDPEIISPGQPAVLSWTSFQGDSVHIDQGIGTVPSNGIISIYPEHTTTYTLTATGLMGTVSKLATIRVNGNPEPLPEGSFGNQYQDLIPSDATIPAYDTARFSIVTGLVHDTAGLPLYNVRVRIVGHPEYGSVDTAIDGRFSIPVEGGKTFTIVYQKGGLLESQRKIYVPWNDIISVDTVQLIAEDSLSTHITFDGDPDTVVTHQSTEICDVSGSRSCSLVFTGDNQAFLVDESGNDVHELTTINVRATEYRTPESMPAKLPPNSAFTYCVELTVDGAKNVRFINPVTIWVDNFLEFDVGEVIPVGFYNRHKGFWEPAENGVVVKLLDIDADGVVDALDATGDEQPDDLNENGTFLDEIKGLHGKERFRPSTTFWRTETTHFTPCDLNLPKGSPTDAVRPNSTGIAKADAQPDNLHSCYRRNASFVEDRSRVFHEDIPVPGTPMMLHYASNRVHGYHTHITVPVSGDTVPASLKRMIVKLEVAGHTFLRELAPLPNQATDFYWDGMDYDGRFIQTPITAHVAVGFVYNSLYYSPGNFEQAFGQPGITATDIPAREEIILWEQKDLLVSPPRSKGTIHFAEGWSLSHHHHMNLQDYGSLHKGDGTLIRTNVRVIRMNYLQGVDYFHYPDSVAADAAGNLYVAESFRGVVYKIDPGGNRMRFAGEFNMWGYSGDGGPAIEARLDRPNGVAVDNAGNVYITDLFRIRKVDANGIITTIAGTGVQGYTGDGGMAVDAQLYSPKGIAVDNDGNIYFAEDGAHCIRKVDANGIITTIAGMGSSGYTGDGGPAVNAELSHPYDVAVDDNGNIYIADSYNHRIRMIDTSGIITTVAGSGPVGYWGGGGYSGDGGPAVDAKMKLPKYLNVDSRGNIYLSDTANLRIRLVNNKGIITTIAGSGAYGWDSSTHPAILAKFKDVSGLAVDAAGNIFIADTDNNSIRKVSHPSVFKNVIQSGGNVFSEGRGQGHIISIEGMHMETIDLDSGVALYTYQYDDNKKLISLTDQFGNVTAVVRDVNGSPTAIISPDGTTTDLTIDIDNHLTRITYPDGSYHVFEYTAGGLLTAKIEPNGNRFEHLFDDRGRLINASDQGGGCWAYTKTTDSNGDDLSCITTAEGNITSYLDHMDSMGTYTSTITDPAGAETLFQRSADGLFSHKSLPCGMDLSFSYDLDTEYLHTVLKEIKEATPSGLTRIIARDKKYQDTDYDSTPDLITQTRAANGQTTSIENNVLLSQETSTSPEGRIVTRLYDPLTLRTASLSIPGYYDTTYGYDSRGKLISISTHTRESSLSYNAQGFVETITDGENHTTSYTHDEVGRITCVDRPDNSSIWFDYDNNGNITVLTNPLSIGHEFGYNTVNLNTSYQTPLSGSYRYVYDRDRQLTQINFPSGNQINNIYDATRLIQSRTPEGDIDFAYLCGTKVDSITMGVEEITYEYDGSLVTAETTTGMLNQTLAFDYNNDFNIVSFSYADDTETYSYDNDGLLTGAGNFAIARNMDNGLPEQVGDGILELSRTFNGYGEVDGEISSINSQRIAAWDLVRDDNGRIVQKTETIAGVAFDFIYTYDPMGRLLTVTKNNVLVEEYQYDLNGSRSYEMNTLRGISGRRFSYSEEDHLLTTGTVSYQYDLDGFLTRKTEGTGITAYDYSSRGQLLSVIFPDDRVIGYVHDPLGRRIAKKVNGAIVEKYLWQGLTRLLAVYDGSDNLLMRFEYADARMPVAMIHNGSTYYLSYDQVGSLRAVADATGNVVKRIDYDTFGNVTGETNPSLGMPFGFAGGLYDKDTGLIRFGYRDYDPDVGRWTAKDPIFFAGGDTDLYGYVLNDPVNLVDPYGLEISDILPGIRTAIVEGLKGSVYSFGETSKFVGSNIKPSEQTLNATIRGATVFGTASAISANIPATITFSVIGGSAKALKSALYSDTPCNDAISQAIQFAVEAPPGFDPLVDKIIEESINVYIETQNLPKM